MSGILIYAGLALWTAGAIFLICTAFAVTWLREKDWWTHGGTIFLFAAIAWVMALERAVIVFGWSS